MLQAMFQIFQNHLCYRQEVCWHTKTNGKKQTPAYGARPGQIQNIYNNWVKDGTSNSYNVTKSSGQYTKKLAVIADGFMPGNMDKNAGKKVCKSKGVGGEKVGCGHHIGGKYVPATPYSKTSSSKNSSSVALNNYINARSGLNPYGWEKPFPISNVNSGNCPEMRARQVTDPVVLGNYYNVNENGTISPRPCHKLPYFNAQNGTGCYYKVSGGPDKSGCPA